MTDLSPVRGAGFRGTTAQGRVFARIGPEGTRLSDLAAQAQITKPTAGFIVDQLERAGLVERVPDPTDGRARLVEITDQGRETIPLAAAEVSAIEAEWNAPLGERRMAELRRTLVRIREITDPYQ